MYYSGLVDHRNISIENIITMEGRLIDLDHAKIVSSSATSRMTPNVSSEEVQSLKTMCRASGQFPSIDEEVLEACITSLPDKNLCHAFDYIASVVRNRIKYFGLDTNRAIKLADIGWHHQVSFKFTKTFSRLLSSR